QLTCAGSLARFTKSAAALAGRSGRGGRGPQAAAAAGGALAAGSLATSALTTVTLTTSRAETDADAEGLYRLMFVAGGPVHGVGLALLIGSLGVAGLRTDELPRQLSEAALVSSVAGALSPLALVAKPGLVFVPLGRLFALVVSGLAGVRLARGTAQ